MSVHGEAHIDAGSPAEAKVLAAALAADDAHVAACRAEGRFVVIPLGGATPMSALRTLDDALDCLRAAGLGSPAAKGRR